ncbi:hypothetical protein MTO96_004068 [Rhipicephalus appendiculatus]
MRTSWVLFAVFSWLLWDLWDRVPLLRELGSFVGSLGIILCVSYCLSGIVWKKLFVKQLPVDGKAVLITGCDSGFGHALATRLSRDGFVVFAGCIDSQSEGGQGPRQTAQCDGAPDGHHQSRARHVTMPMGVPYCMTKYALVSMVDGLRRECKGKGVDFVAIEPIAYKTAITTNLGAEAETLPELQQQSPEVVADYSAEEVQRWLDMPRQLYELISRDDVNEVVDQMVLAIRETDPKTRYISKFCLGGFLYYGAVVLPTELADLAIGLGMRTLPFVSRMMRTRADKRE